MTGLEVFAIQAGIGAITSMMGHQQESDNVAYRNRQARQRAKYEQRQRLAMHNTEWNNIVEAYNLKVGAYKKGLTARAQMTGMELSADELRLNQMMKGMRFASQDESIAQSQAIGKATARAGGTGRTAGRKVAMTAGAFLRNQAKREEKMLGEIFAHNMKGEARIASLNAANQRAHASVAFAPKYGTAPTMGYVAQEQGPSSMSLLMGIGGAAMSGFSAGLGQSQFRQQLAMSNNPGGVPIPS
tara:strand:- start:959 stop:1687 length:729 start_codon:yes stop_codon:yes gene_type:complete